MVCEKCVEEFQTITNQCRDECDISNGKGCNQETEECRIGKYINKDGDEFDHTYCHCLVPEDELEDKDICKYKINCRKEGSSQDCSGNGKCVDLPGIIGKSCLCQIDWAGEYCEQPRTCKNGHGRFQNFCLNGGKCKEKSDTVFECDCGAEFFGKHCENVHSCHHLKVF